MNITRDDLKRLGLPIAVCLALVLAGAAALAASLHVVDKARKESGAVRLARVAAQEKVAKATEEEREIRENLVHYQQLLARGIIGEEKRLDWVDNIAQIRAQRKLFEIGYDIDVQKPLTTYPGVASAAGVQFMTSRMKVDMPLLHEEDLLNFLSDLQTAGKAYVSVRKCSVDRTDRGAPPTGRGMAPRLHSSCDIDMITIREKEAS